MSKNKLLITDTHFGWKDNSITWLKSQLELFDKQIIPYLEQHPDTKVIHLGDVFESRSSISPRHAKEVRERFVKIADIVDEFYIIAGNHDFYSPTSSEYESISLVFRGSNIKYVIDDIVISDDDMMIPWYKYKEVDIQGLLKLHPNVKYIYTHADIFGIDKKDIPSNITLFSGHIHTPRSDNNLINIGSCYPLDFNDANQKRFFYVIENNELIPYENRHCIQFHRVYDDIFDKKYFPNDYYEIYLDAEKMGDQKYKDFIRDISEKCKNIRTIPVSKQIIMDETYVGQDIETICNEYIPDNLKDKFQRIISKSKEDET